MSDKNFENNGPINTNNNKERSYWLNKLSGDTQLSRFPIDNFQSKTHHYNGASNNCALSEITYSKLLSMSNKSEYALYMILLSGVEYLLNKYAQIQDIVVIMPVFKQKGDADTLINRILPLRSKIDANNSFRELLQEIKTTVMEANANQNFPIMNLLSSLNTELGDNKLPILNTVVLLDSIHDKNYIGDMKSDMFFSFLRTSDSIEINIEYNSVLYSEDTIKYLTKYLNNYFDVIVNNPNIKLNEINIMLEDDERTILEKSVSSDTKYINLGGKVETTINAILKNLTGSKLNSDNGNQDTIGKYILDENGKVQPIGISGELYVEVDDLEKYGISKENLNLEATTLETSISNKKLYKTGCLARWVEENVIEYIGRVSQSISIRGSHINLNEIEMLLLQREDISEIKVIQKQGDNDRKYICAYFKAYGDINTGELKEYLSKIALDYMMPNYFIEVENMPLKNDGTLNEEELPSPNKSMNEENEIQEIQEKLLKIWKNILGLEDINIDDDFFDLGGHSILAIKLEVEMETKGMLLSSTEIFNYRTIREQAAEIWNNM